VEFGEKGELKSVPRMRVESRAQDGGFVGAGLEGSYEERKKRSTHYYERENLWSVLGGAGRGRINDFSKKGRKEKGRLKKRALATEERKTEKTKLATEAMGLGGRIWDYASTCAKD